jgi:hypothetical protein
VPVPLVPQQTHGGRRGGLSASGDASPYPIGGCRFGSDGAANHCCIPNVRGRNLEQRFSRELLRF